MAPVLDYINTDVELELSLWYPPLSYPTLPKKQSSTKTKLHTQAFFLSVTDFIAWKRKKYFSKKINTIVIGHYTFLFSKVLLFSLRESS